MGIYLFIYISLIDFFSASLTKKLYIIADSSKVNKNEFWIKYSRCANSPLILKKINFFKKSSGLALFFLDNSLSRCSRALLPFNFSDEKSLFLTLNLFNLFLKKNSSANFFKEESSNLSLFILTQLFLAFYLNAGRARSDIFFLDFKKIFDFIIFKGIVFTSSKVSTFSSVSALEPQQRSETLNKKLSAAQIRKYNFLVEDTDLLNTSSCSFAEILYLFNNFFTKSKNFFFLRNNEIYNKSRYSRNRQTYKTGVFWCIWLTVLTVIGLYFYFYIFLIKFTYIWVFFFIFILSFFLYYFKSKVERHFFY